MERTLQANYAVEVSRPTVAPHARCEGLRVASGVEPEKAKPFLLFRDCAFAENGSISFYTNSRREKRKGERLRTPFFPPTA
jgi:hypothetical protein